MLKKVKVALRKMKTDPLDGEIKDIIAACRLDMIQSGVSAVKAHSDDDPLITRAIILYAKGHFGYIEDAHAFLQSYEMLRDKLSLSIAIGNPLISSPDFPPLRTVHETFISHGAPSGIQILHKQ